MKVKKHEMCEAKERKNQGAECQRDHERPRLTERIGDAEGVKQQIDAATQHMEHHGRYDVDAGNEKNKREQNRSNKAPAQ